MPCGEAKSPPKKSFPACSWAHSTHSTLVASVQRHHGLAQARLDLDRVQDGLQQGTARHSSSVCCKKLQDTQTKHAHSMHGSSARQSWTSDAAASPGAAVRINVGQGRSKAEQAQQAECTLSQASSRICLSSAMRGYRGLAPAAGSGKQSSP